MSNYFTTVKNNRAKKEELLNALAAIREQEQAERETYLTAVRNIITAKPGLTAVQYASLLSNDAAERNSIASSIGMMGYMANNGRYYNYDISKPSCVCGNPAIPNLVRKYNVIKRRFMELDENGNQLGSIFETIEYKSTYRIEEK